MKKTLDLIVQQAYLAQDTDPQAETEIGLLRADGTEIDDLYYERIAVGFEPLFDDTRPRAANCAPICFSPIGDRERFEDGFTVFFLKIFSPNATPTPEEVAAGTTYTGRAYQIPLDSPITVGASQQLCFESREIIIDYGGSGIVPVPQTLFLPSTAPGTGAGQADFIASGVTGVVAGGIATFMPPEQFCIQPPYGINSCWASFFGRGAMSATPDVQEILLLPPQKKEASFVGSSAILVQVASADAPLVLPPEHRCIQPGPYDINSCWASFFGRGVMDAVLTSQWAPLVISADFIGRTALRVTTVSVDAPLVVPPAEGHYLGTAAMHAETASVDAPIHLPPAQALATFIGAGALSAIPDVGLPMTLRVLPAQIKREGSDTWELITDETEIHIGDQVEIQLYVQNPAPIARSFTVCAAVDRTTTAYAGTTQLTPPPTTTPPGEPEVLEWHGQISRETTTAFTYAVLCTQEAGAGSESVAMGLLKYQAHQITALAQFEITNPCWAGTVTDLTLYRPLTLYTGAASTSRGLTHRFSGVAYRSLDEKLYVLTEQGSTPNDSGGYAAIWRMDLDGKNRELFFEFPYANNNPNAPEDLEDLVWVPSLDLFFVLSQRQKKVLVIDNTGTWLNDSGGETLSTIDLGPYVAHTAGPCDPNALATPNVPGVSVRGPNALAYDPSTEAGDVTGDFYVGTAYNGGIYKFQIDRSADPADPSTWVVQNVTLVTNPSTAASCAVGTPPDPCSDTLTPGTGCTEAGVSYARYALHPGLAFYRGILYAVGRCNQQLYAINTADGKLIKAWTLKDSSGNNPVSDVRGMTFMDRTGTAGQTDRRVIFTTEGDEDTASLGRVHQFDLPGCFENPIGTCVPTTVSGPVVVWVAPLDGANLNRGQTIQLEVQASDVDGGIDRVEFYAAGRKLGTDTNAVGPTVTGSFYFNWVVPAGSTVLVATAYTPTGIARSATISVNAEGQGCPDIEFIPTKTDPPVLLATPECGFMVQNAGDTLDSNYPNTVVEVRLAARLFNPTAGVFDWSQGQAIIDDLIAEADGGDKWAKARKIIWRMIVGGITEDQMPPDHAAIPGYSVTNNSGDTFSYPNYSAAAYFAWAEQFHLALRDKILTDTDWRYYTMGVQIALGNANENTTSNPLWQQAPPRLSQMMTDARHKEYLVMMHGIYSATDLHLVYPLGNNAENIEFARLGGTAGGEMLQHQDCIWDTFHMQGIDPTSSLRPVRIGLIPDALLTLREQGVEPASFGGESCYGGNNVPGHVDANGNPDTIVGTGDTTGDMTAGFSKMRLWGMARYDHSTWPASVATQGGLDYAATTQFFRPFISAFYITPNEDGSSLVRLVFENEGSCPSPRDLYAYVKNSAGESARVNVGKLPPGQVRSVSIPITNANQEQYAALVYRRRGADGQFYEIPVEMAIDGKQADGTYEMYYVPLVRSQSDCAGVPICARPVNVGAYNGFYVEDTANDPNDVFSVALFAADPNWNPVGLAGAGWNTAMVAPESPAFCDSNPAARSKTINDKILCIMGLGDAGGNQTPVVSSYAGHKAGDANPRFSADTANENTPPRTPAGVQLADLVEAASAGSPVHVMAGSCATIVADALKILTVDARLTAAQVADGRVIVHLEAMRYQLAGSQCPTGLSDLHFNSFQDPVAWKILFEWTDLPLYILPWSPYQNQSAFHLSDSDLTGGSGPGQDILNYFINRWTNAVDSAYYDVGESCPNADPHYFQNQQRSMNPAVFVHICNPANAADRGVMPIEAPTWNTGVLDEHSNLAACDGGRTINMYTISASQAATIKTKVMNNIKSWSIPAGCLTGGC